MDDRSSSMRKMTTKEFLDNYWDIIGGIILAIFTFIAYKQHNIYLSTVFAAAAIGFLSITVSEIAEILAERLGEPLGSYVLTITAVTVEILLLFNVLLEASNNPSALDTVKGGIISAVIVDMNVLLGLAVFIGGLAFREQQHNEDTSSTYTTILYVSALALLVPSILKNTNHATKTLQEVSFIIGGLLFAFYIVILIFQTKTHTHFFKATARSRIFRFKRELKEDEEETENYIFDKFSNMWNFFVIFILIFIIGLLAELFAHDGLYLAKELDISTGIAGLFIAVISVAPEIFTAVKAARNDQIQRVINIAMGASTVSILLTVPALLLLSSIFHLKLTLGFNALEIGALIFTIILAWKTTDDGETNYFEGISHLMLFLCYAVIAAYY